MKVFELIEHEKPLNGASEAIGGWVDETGAPMVTPNGEWRITWDEDEPSVKVTTRRLGRGKWKTTVMYLPPSIE